MQSLEALTSDAKISSVLKDTQSIAVVGLSPKENRPSNMVGRYLLEAGYTVIPVNPGQDEIFGLQCHPDLEAIPHPVDLVDIFRRPEDVYAIVESILRMKSRPKTVWMQQGIVNEVAADLARKNGLFVVMDRCIKIDHANLL